MRRRLFLIFLFMPFILQADLEQYVTRNTRMMVTPENVELEQIQDPTLINKWEREFQSIYGEDWTVQVDKRSEVPSHIIGGGIPFFPGSANQLSYDYMVEKETVINLMTEFFIKHSTLFHVDPTEIRCEQAIQIDNKWYLSFVRYYKDVPVENSSALASLFGGNLYEFGFTKWGSISLSTTPELVAESALAMLFSSLGGQDPYLDVITNPGSLVILPLSADDALSLYEGEVGKGYTHKLAWAFEFVRGTDGPWKAFVDANTGEILSFYRDAMTAIHRASATGNIYNHAINAEGHSYSGPYGMPYTDIRERYYCYEHANEYCSTLWPDSSGQKPVECFANAAGTYRYDDQSSSSYSGICINPSVGFQTRLFGEKVYIVQNSYLNDPIGCPGDNPEYTFDESADRTYLCSHPQEGDPSDVEILLGGIAGDDRDWCQRDEPCPWCIDDSESLACGNNNATRTAYYHANLFKEYWGSKFSTHPSITNWINKRLEVRTNWGNGRLGNGSEYVYQSGGATEYLILSANYTSEDPYPEGAKFRNDALFPSTMYHELGHALEIYRRTDDNNDESISSKESFSDIIAALMTQDSCIGRGAVESNPDIIEHTCPFGSYINGNSTSNDGCSILDNDNNNLPDDGFPLCNGFRDINYLHHTSQEKYTPQNFVNSYCEESTGYDGPCGRQAHCESQVASQAFWEMREAFEDYYEGCGYSSFRAKRMSWHKAEALFINAISQLDHVYYNCDLVTGSSDGSSADSLFNRLRSADINSGSSNHYKEIFEAFNNHNIAATPIPYGPSDCPNTPRIFAVVATPSYNTILLSWEPAPNIQLYRIYRSQLGPDSGFILLSSTYSSSYIDEAVSNAMTYWYRVVPIEANTYDFGAFGEVGPILPSGGLLVLPDPPADDFNENPLYFSTTRIKSVQLSAYGGFGGYTWSETTGNIPTWLTLDPQTGVLSGMAPTSSSPVSITIQATDTNDPSLVGTRNYQIMVLTGNVGSLTMSTEYLEPAIAGKSYDVGLGLFGSPTGYRVEISEGTLPQGMYIMAPTPNNWHIQGTPTLDAVGLYKFTVAVTSGSGDFTYYLDRSFYLAVLDRNQTINNSFVATPTVGSTVGGNTIILSYSTPTQMRVGGGKLRFISSDASCDDSAPYIEQPNMTILEQHELSFGIGQTYWLYLLEADVPSLPEGDYHLLLYRATGSTCSAINYSAHVYAFTANQGTRDVSVIDTTENQIVDLDASLTGNQRMSMPAGTIPWGMALSKTPKDSIEFYVVDYGLGDVQVYDAVNYAYETTIQLQNRDDFAWAGLGAVDVDVDSQGFAYVIHTTGGLQDQPGFPYPIWNPIYGSISVIDTATKTLVDVDPDDPKYQIGWMPGIHRIRTFELYPYSISILRRDPGNVIYEAGDGYPGEYAFISGVGPQPPDPIGWQAVGCTDGLQVINCLPSTPPCACPYGWWHIWEPMYDVRPITIGILDLNPQIVATVDSDGHPLTYASNEVSYRKFLGVQNIGEDGRRMGQANQGLDFAIYPDGSNAWVFAVSPTEDKVYYFNFKDAITNPTTFNYTSLDLVSGDHPSDVAVEEINGIPYAFTSNRLSDTVSVIQATQDPLPFVAGTIDISEAACPISTDFSPFGRDPIAIDTRSKGDYGYTVNTNSGTVTIIDLVNLSCQGDIVLDETEWTRPWRIAIQPVNTVTDFYQSVKTELAVAPDTSFSEAPKKDNLIREWEGVNDLQETSADSTAVLVHIDNFQRNVVKWITDENTLATVNQSIDLYRTAYLMEQQ